MKARERIERWSGDPVAFLRDELRFYAYSRQREIAESVRDHRRTVCRSAHAVGKTAVCGRIVLWWLAAFPGSIAITTSATWNQVREQLWRELAIGYHAASKLFASATLTDTRLELGPDSFALGLSTTESERFAGYHSARCLVVLDEASGVPEPVWEAAETLITSPDSRLLAIGNPTRASGSFYRAFTSERDLYNTLHVSAFDSPAVTGEKVPRPVRNRLVSRDWIEDRRRAWGENSPLWDVRVMGNFPSVTDDSVVALADVEAARARELEEDWPLILSADIARFGSDSTCLAVRRGDVVRIAKVYGGRDLMHTTGAIVALGRDLHDKYGRRPKIIVDDVGLGGGVTDRLREQGEFEVVAYNGARASSWEREYPNSRSADWFGFAELLPQLDLDDDEELANDLLAPRYTLDSRGRRVVERKSETKKRLRRSPDRADAVIMAYSIDRPGRSIRMTTHVARSRIGRSPEGIAAAFARDRDRRPAPRIALPTSGRGDALDDISARTGIPIYRGG